MNSCKAMQAQSKSMKSNWPTACGGGAGRVRFQGTKKRPDKGKQLNALSDNTVKEVIKSNKRAKYIAAHDSGLEEDLDNFNF